MPLLPASLIEPLWVGFAALIGSAERPEFCLAHAWGRHRRRILDRVVCDRVIAALVHGSGGRGPVDRANSGDLFEIQDFAGEIAVKGVRPRSRRGSAGRWSARTPG